jgi:hypothetical protein
MGKQRWRRRPVPVDPEPVRASIDPCACFDSCPDCDTRCMGGHALSPRLHMCVELHWWGERW